jgi:hypothetical protein
MPLHDLQPRTPISITILKLTRQCSRCALDSTEPIHTKAFFQAMASTSPNYDQKVHSTLVVMASPHERHSVHRLRLQVQSPVQRKLSLTAIVHEVTTPANTIACCLERARLLQQTPQVARNLLWESVLVAGCSGSGVLHRQFLPQTSGPKMR